MKPTTKKENTDLSSLYDKIYNERMNTIQEQEDVDTGGAVAKATRIKAEVEEGVRNMEKIMGATFGDNENPLLLSVRSAARASMPGMMDTILE